MTPKQADALLRYIDAVNAEHEEVFHENANFGEHPLEIRDEVRAVSIDEEDCEHEWVSADNEVVTGAEICVKCRALRASES